MRRIIDIIIGLVSTGLIFASLLSVPAMAQSGQPIRTYAKKICSSLTVTAGAYTAGYDMGGKITFSNAGRELVGTGIITGVTISDLAVLGKQMELVLFNTNPSATTFTDNAALDVADADLPKIAGTAYVNSFAAFADNGIAYAQNLAIPFDTGKSTSANYSLYAALIAREALTPASTADYQVCVYVQQD